MDLSVNILLVENNAQYLHSIQDELSKSAIHYQFAIAVSEVEYVRLIASFSPQIILADYSQGPFSGLQAFNLKQKIAPDTSFVLICNSVKEAFSTDIVKKGIVRYVAIDQLFTLNSIAEISLAEIQGKTQKRKTERQLEIIYNEVEDMIFMLKVEDGGRFKFVSVNRSFLRITGLQMEQVINQYADAVVPAASKDNTLNMFNECVKTKETVAWEADFGAGKRTGHIRLTPICNTRRKCTHLIGAVHEITEQKILMRSLEESNQRYDYVTRATSDAIWDWDIAADKVFWGDAYYHLFGRISEDESNIDVINMRIHPDDIYELLANANEAIKNIYQTNWHREHRYLKSNGEYAFVSNKAIIIRNPEGMAIRVIGAIEDITAKKTLENALHKSITEARFGTWEMNIERHTLHWSDMMRDIVDAPADYQPTIENRLKYYKTEEGRALITEKIKNAVEKGESFDIETECLTPKGVVKWVRVMGTPEFENGQCLKICGSLQDINTRKLAELTVEKALREKTNILESIADAFFAMDEQWVVTYWNNHAEKIFEKNRDEIVGKNIWTVFPNRLDSAAHKEYAHAMATGEVKRFEDYSPKLKKWFYIGCYPAENGGLSVYVKDVTARKEAELKLIELNASLREQASALAINNKALEASEKRFSDIFHLSPQPMWLFDEDSLRFVQVNEAAVNLYGYSAAEFMQMSLLDIKVPDQSLHVKDEISNATTAGTMYNQTYRHRKKSGAIMEVEIYSTHMEMDGKKLRSSIAIDVTEKNRQEYNIIKAIIKTQEDERYEMGSELHDNVCQILAGSQFFLQMLHDALPVEKWDFYKNCKDNIQLALDETRNLSHRLAPAFFDDSTLEDSFKKMLDNFSTGSNISINLHFDHQLRDQPITLEAQLNLYRILQEQIRNIFKYANASMIEIHTLLEDSKLIMTITDDGVGFNKAQIKKGIGFANMKRRTELFSGKFEVYSDPGNGCTIEVLLPLEEIIPLT